MVDVVIVGVAEVVAVIVGVVMVLAMVLAIHPPPGKIAADLSYRWCRRCRCGWRC